MVPKRPLDEKMETGTLATNVWASARRPDEMRHVPLDRRVLLFLSRRWNMRTRRQESAWLAVALPSTNLHDSMSTHRLTQRAQSFRRITDGHEACPDPAAGRDAGEEDCIQRTSTMPGNIRTER